MSADAATFWIIASAFGGLAVGFFCGWMTFGKEWD